MPVWLVSFFSRKGLIALFVVLLIAGTGYGLWQLRTMYIEQGYNQAKLEQSEQREKDARDELRSIRLAIEESKATNQRLLQTLSNTTREVKKAKQEIARIADKEPSAVRRTITVPPSDKPTEVEYVCTGKDVNGIHATFDVGVVRTLNSAAGYSEDSTNSPARNSDVESNSGTTNSGS